MKKVISICLLSAVFFAQGGGTKQTSFAIDDKLFYGEASENFVIRWGFQHHCNFVFDPRTDQYVWPTKSDGGVTFDPSKVRPGDIILVRDAPLFFKKMHPKIQHPYIIVTHGEHLDKMSKAHESFLEEEKVIAWFGIHASKKIKHPKFFQIPIGVIQQPANYKKKGSLNELFTKLRKTSEHKYMLYMNFADVNKPERKKVREMFSHKHYCKRGQRQPFNSYLKEMAQCKFTLSPKGLGPDCYRTWESLLCGSIPIVRTCQLDPLYEGLPVLIVDSWEEINEDYLERKYREIMSRKYDIRPLYMEYWVAKINAVKEQFLAQHKAS